MNYYNDHDPFCCAWLKELMADGLIPEGEIDGRPIEEVEPGDLRGFTQCHFFCGISGWSLALGLAGWPADKPVWTGSCPCQPLSCAGKGKGHEDKRHLWPEFYRLIRECSPPVVFGEQTQSKLGREWLDGVSLDLEALGYAVGAADLCAAGIGGPHIRQRLFWVAHSTGPRCQPTWQGSKSETLHETRVRGFKRRRDAGGLADAERYDGRPDEQGRGKARREVDGRASPWHPSLLIPCADGKLRRVPGEWVEYPKGARQRSRSDCTERDDSSRFILERSGSRGNTEFRGKNGISNQGPEAQSSLQSMLPDGFPAGLVHLRPSRELFPLSEGCKNRVGILRGAGNSIVPSLAAEFVRAFMEVEYER